MILKRRYRDSRDACDSAHAVANQTGRVTYALLSEYGELELDHVERAGWRTLRTAHPQFA